MAASTLQRYRAADGVLVSGGEDAFYVTDTKNGSVYELNATARLIFERARVGASGAEVIAALAVAFPEVPRDELERDAAEVLHGFVAAGLLEHAA